MLDNPYKTARSTKKSVVFRCKDSGALYKNDLYAHMLREDIGLGIVPIGREKRDRIDVAIEPFSDEVKYLIKLALPNKGYHQNTLKESMLDFIEKVSGTLVFYGTACYEIVYYYDDDKLVGFQYDYILNENVNNILGLYVQHVPRNIYGDRNNYSKKIIFLPRKSLLVFKWPKILGGVEQHKKIFKQLAWVSKSILPEFAMEAMEKNDRVKGYDFNVYRYNENVYIARTTKDLGWGGRSLFSDNSLEYYEIYRFLKFEKSKAILREYILNRLNKSLDTVGRKMGFKASIKIDGLKSSQEIGHLMEKIKKGALQFSEVIEQITSKE